MGFFSSFGSGFFLKAYSSIIFATSYLAATLCFGTVSFHLLPLSINSSFFLCLASVLVTI
jgi:hypothetical protein